MSDKPVSGPGPFDFFSWVNQFAQPVLEATNRMITPGTGPGPGPATSATTAPGPGADAGGDPLAIWQNFSQQNEKAFTQFMAQLVTTPEFAAGLGRSATNQAMLRDTTRKAALAYLEAANMPSRDDISRVAALVVALDSKLDNLEERLYEAHLEQLAGRLDRLSQQLERLDRRRERAGEPDKLDGLAERLSAIEARLDWLLSDRVAQAETQAQAQTAAPAQTEAPPRKVSSRKAPTRKARAEAPTNPPASPAPPKPRRRTTRSKPQEDK